MKTNLFVRQFAIFSALVLPTSLQALEVHEWGTFTVLVNSNGSAVNWYQPYSDIAELPAFTRNNLRMMKSSVGAAKVRMETPVIYFYPEEEMDVRVKVMFQNGSITERFPAASSESYGFIDAPKHEPGVLTSYVKFQQRYDALVKNNFLIITEWSGKLLPPSHPNAKLIPSVAGHKGENYGAAREVPDAWIFHSDTSVMKTQKQPDIHPVEKFIFYRGVGQNVPPYSVTMRDEQTIHFASYAQSANAFQVALRVRDGRATWIQLPSLPTPKEYADRETKISFPQTSMSIEQADKELCALFLSALTEHGLTEAEARAMIKTWNHTWFSETGTRVFTIVDPNWVDGTLPLAIHPNPQSVKRVFVARYEILSPDTENQLAALLREENPSDASVKALKALDLGRFANGAAEIVSEREKMNTLSRYSRLWNQIHQNEAK